MLVQFFGEETPCLMYSQRWKRREQGVQNFTANMKKALDELIQNTQNKNEVEPISNLSKE